MAMTSLGEDLSLNLIPTSPFEVQTENEKKYSTECAAVPWCHAFCEKGNVCLS